MVINMQNFEHRIMYIFPGQGSQYMGMGSDIYAEYTAAKKIYNCASEILGYDITELSFNDPNDELNQTQFTQPALLTHSIACLEVFKELTDNRITPNFTAGHSLGEYSALVAAGSLTFENALRLVQRRGELMSLYGRGKMMAFPLDLKSVRSFVNSFYCEVGGCNLPEQTVVGGTEENLNSIYDYVLSKYKKKGKILNTEGAFHTYLMIKASEEFLPILKDTIIVPPKFVVLSNYYGDYHSSIPSEIRSSLFFQLFNPVKWIWGIQKAFRDGVNSVIEFGGGIGDGDEPNSKRPNLESITIKAIRRLKQNVIYSPAINSRTLKKSSGIFRTLNKVVDESRDDLPGTSVDENWFHLLVPTQNEMITTNSIKLVSLVYELGLSPFIQIICQSSEKNRQWIRDLIDPKIKEPQPYLEKIIGCETAAILYYSGKEIEENLVELKERLENPAYRNNAKST